MTGYPEAVLARELEICYAAICLVTDLDAGVAAGEGVKAVDIFTQFEKNIDLFKKLVRAAIDRVDVERTCTHCLSHTGVTLPDELP
jgi:5'-methylthioadenosine phosphorylase